MASRLKHEHYVRRHQRHATWSYRERKAKMEIERRIRHFGKRHQINSARALVRRFQEASEIEMLQWLQCGRKRQYPSIEKADLARISVPNGARMTSFACGWEEGHYHIGHPSQVARSLTREVRAIRDLISYRRQLLKEAS